MSNPTKSNEATENYAYTSIPAVDPTVDEDTKQVCEGEEVIVVQGDPVEEQGQEGGHHGRCRRQRCRWQGTHRGRCHGMHKKYKRRVLAAGVAGAVVGGFLLCGPVGVVVGFFGGAIVAKTAIKCHLRRKFAAGCGAGDAAGETNDKQEPLLEAKSVVDGMDDDTPTVPPYEAKVIA